MRTCNVRACMLGLYPMWFSYVGCKITTFHVCASKPWLKLHAIGQLRLQNVHMSCQRHARLGWCLMPLADIHWLIFVGFVHYLCRPNSIGVGNTWRLLTIVCNARAMFAFMPEDDSVMCKTNNRRRKSTVDVGREMLWLWTVWVAHDQRQQLVVCTPREVREF